MRSIGKAEKALELMVKRSATREAFGKPIAKLGKNREVISNARIEINAMKLAVLQAAKAMAGLGIKALTDPELIKAAKADLKRRTARTPYVCPLPDHVAPPLDMSVA